MGFFTNLIQKLNPGQRYIAEDQGTGEQATTQTKLVTIEKTYELVEIVARLVNMTVDNLAMVDYEVLKQLSFTGARPNVKMETIKRLLNDRPNPYMDLNTFKRLTFMDFLVDGNSFWYFDGASLYHLPARLVTIVPDERTFVNKYVFAGRDEYLPNEIIHVQDNSVSSVYRGDSRITSCLQSLYTRESMQDFQKAFFDNGTALGLIVETEATLNKKMRERKEAEWVRNYNPRSGNGKPLILDSGMKARSITNSNFRELSFTDSIKEAENRVALALGVPPILLEGGNNANIKPNLELWFNATLIPIMRRYESALEYFFGVDIEISTFRVPALFPDRKAESDRLVSLKNNGIISGNEAREALKLERSNDPEMDKIHQPRNIAGSAAGEQGGGRPEEEEDNE